MEYVKDVKKKKNFKGNVTPLLLGVLAVHSELYSCEALIFDL